MVQQPVLPSILVVDDEARNRELVRGFLASKYRVLEAEGGAEALEVLERERVDLVILDVMMPGLSGFDVCRRMKETSGEGFLPVLLVTALGEHEDRIAGLSAGADDFLAKPVYGRELNLRVRTFLRLREQEALIRSQLESLRHLQSLKEDLFSLIVHDIRNPLMGVEGHLELLEGKLGDGSLDHLRKNVDGALESAHQVHEIVDTVLDVCRLEQEGLTLRRETGRLQTLLEEAVAPIRGAGLASGVDIRLRVQEDPRVWLDAKLARHCIENLLSNAIKYSPEDGVVEATGTAEAAGVTIEVADRGPGIPNALKSQMFEKFDTVEGRTGGARRGYGLGLHLVKLVMTAHEGHVSVRDREGGGSVFPSEPLPPERPGVVLSEANRDAP